MGQAILLGSDDNNVLILNLSVFIRVKRTFPAFLARLALPAFPANLLFTADGHG